MKNREEAKTKYDWGNKIIAKQGVENILLALDYYQKSLFLLRSIEKAEATDEDNKSIRDVLEALLKGINQLLHSSSDWSQVMDALEKFLTFYVDSVRILNKTNQRLPGLHVLELKIGGPFTALSTKAPSEPQNERLKNYLAVISLFHEDLKTEFDHKITSKDPLVTKSFALYTRALNAFKATAKFEDLAEEEQPPPKKVPPPAVLLQHSTSALPAAATSRSSRFNFAQQPKETKLHTFDYIAPDGPKRVLIRELMDKKEFVKALAGCRNIMNHIVNDFRCTCECLLAIGIDHANKGQFIESITCYTEALQSCTHIRKDDFIEKDIISIETGFIALIHAINEITKNCAVNFLSASKSLTTFLNFYLDNFGFLNTENKTRSSLDEINIDFLIEFLKSTPDDTSREKTRVYLAIIGIFRQETKLENGGLESMMDEIEIKKGIWKDASMLETFNLFDKAVALAKSIKGHPALNPELNAAPEPDKKRRKDVTGPSSSSSLPQFGQ